MPKNKKLLLKKKKKKRGFLESLGIKIGLNEKHPAMGEVVKRDRKIKDIMAELFEDERKKKK